MIFLKCWIKLSAKPNASVRITKISFRYDILAVSPNLMTCTHEHTHTHRQAHALGGSTSFPVTATDQPSRLLYGHVNETRVCIIPMHQITVTMPVLQKALFCQTVPLKSEEGKDGRRGWVRGGLGWWCESGVSKGENKDEDRSPAPVVYGIVNRKLFLSPKYFFSQKNLWASSGPDECDSIREG